LDKFAEHTFDVVFLDLDMPVMDGMKAARIIKQEYPKAIIIIMTILYLY